MRQKRENVRYLPGVELPEVLHITDQPAQTLAGTEVVLFATPSHGLRAAARSLSDLVPQNCIAVSATKGLEVDTCLRMTEVLEQELPALQGRIAALSGPNHAEEVGRRMPGASVVACKDRAVAEYVQDAFMTPNFRIYANSDVVGVELGGALKNVIALAAGMADGLGYGDNTKAALITRGIKEISRLGVAMGANSETLNGLSGIGDLIVTCASRHSRNRKAGMLIGRGYSMQQAMDEVKMVVEGVYSAKAAIALAKKYEINMPIIEQVNEVLFNKKPADAAVKDLMIRDKKLEHRDLPWNE